MPPIRTALIAGSPKEREFLQNELARYKDTVEVVYEGNDLTVGFKGLLAANPTLILISEGMGNTFYSELDPSFKKIRQKMPNAKILIRSHLERTHPFIQAATEGGASIVGGNINIQQLVEGMQRVNEGEKIVVYPGTRDHLDTYQSRRNRER